jgi:hypothetical protein
VTELQVSDRFGSKSVGLVNLLRVLGDISIPTLADFKSRFNPELKLTYFFGFPTHFDETCCSTVLLRSAASFMDLMHYKNRFG